MPGGRVLHGRVVDAAGRGVPYALLSFYGGRMRPPVSADADGRFRVVAMDGTEFSVHVRAPGFRLWTRTFTVTEDEITVTLRRSVQLRFRLRGDVPPSGSWVMVWFREAEQSGWGGGGTAVVSGQVFFDLMHDSKAREYVLKGDGWQTETVHVAPVQGTWVMDVPVDVVPAPTARYTQMGETNPGGKSVSRTDAPDRPAGTGTIRGRVQGGADDFRGSSVVARGPKRTKILRIGDVEHEVDDTPRHQAPLEADGRFALDRIPAGTWTVFCQRNGRHENEVEVTVEAKGIIEVLDLRAPARGPSIHGVVRDSDGQPVAGLQVQASPSGFHGRTGRAMTGIDGRFEVDDLVDGQYRLHSRDERGQVEERTVSAGDRNVALRFTAHGLLRGTLSGPWGDADLPQGRLLIIGEPDGRLSTSARLQRNGHEFFFESRLPPGAYRLAARIGGFVTAAETTVTIRAGTVLPRVDLALVRGGTVVFTLVDATGKRQPGGWIDLPPAWHLHWPMDVESDPEGGHRLEGIPPGMWTLKARGRAGYGEVTVVVAEGETLHSDIVLSK